MALNLGLFNTTTALVDPATGYGSNVFIRWINSVVQKIQDALNQIATVVSDVQSALTAAGVAVDTSTGAETAANAAALAVASTATELALNNSYISPYISITGHGVSHTLASDDATITIPAHTRVYGDATSVSVGGGSFTGKNTATRYYIYYDDPTHVGGSVTYQLTTDATIVGQIRGRHFVGVITTPASSAVADTVGQTILPPRVIL